MSAYELAVEQRSDMIEIDLHRTRDGEIVITHDEDLPVFEVADDARPITPEMVDAALDE